MIGHSYLRDEVFRFWGGVVLATLDRVEGVLPVYSGAAIYLAVEHVRRHGCGSA